MSIAAAPAAVPRADAESEDTRWADALAAAHLLAADPEGLRGALVRAAPGPVRDLWLEALREALPSDAPFRRLPPGIEPARLIGGLDLAATLAAGRPVGERGLIAEAEGGVLIAPMAERLGEAVTTLLIAALDRGGVALVLLDEGGEDEAAPGALAERVAFRVELGRPAPLPFRGGDRSGRPCLRHGPATCRRHVAPLRWWGGRLRAGTQAATPPQPLPWRGGAAKTPPPSSAPPRLPSASIRCARHSSPCARRARAPRLPGGTRQKRMTCCSPPVSCWRRARPGCPPPKRWTRPPNPTATTVHRAMTPTPATVRSPIAWSRRRARRSRRGCWRRSRAEACRAAPPPAGAAPARSGARHATGARAGSRAGRPSDGARLDLIETLRAAAPWQVLRRSEACADATGADRILIRRDDFRVRRFVRRVGSTTIFVVDASGSAAMARLGEAKGAVELLLAEAYVRRDEVALIAFRGAGAELLLPPTRSLARARRNLADLAGGGGTPLAAAIQQAAALAGGVRAKGRAPLVVLLTDGRANVARDGATGGAHALADAEAASRALAADGIAAVFIDTAARARPEGRRLAEAMRARYLALPRVAAEAVRDARARRAMSRAPKWEVEGRDWPNRDASRFVAAGGIDWHVQVTGQEQEARPAILLLHGTGAATHSWRDLAPLLAAHATVIAPDLPGHGFTGTPRDMTLPGIARAVAALLGALGVEPALIVGHSAGAAVALRLVLDGAAAPRGLVGIGAALLPFPGLAARLFPAMAKLLFVNPLVPQLFAMRANIPGEVERFLRQATGSRIDARGAELYARLLRAPRHVAGALAMMANWDLAALSRDMARLAVPLTLPHGDRDAAVPIGSAREVAAKVPDGAVVPLSGLGHLAHEEAPARLAEILLEIARARGILPAREEAPA